MSFLYALLSWNPSWRSTAQEALKHSYFRNAKSNNPELSSSMAQSEDQEQPLSLALRPRGQNSVTAVTTATTATTAATAEEPDAGGGNVVAGRKPFPVAEIEPHYSREPTQLKPQQQPADDKTDQDSKNNNNNNTINGKLATTLAEPQIMTDDINDLLSAFSIGVVGDAAPGAPPASKSRASQRRRLRNVVLMSPAASASASIKDKMPKFSNIEVNGEGQPTPSHSPRRFSVYKSKHQQRLWNGGIGLGGNFPSHHIVHSHHHASHHHHHHHLHHFGDSKIVDLSPNASK